MLIFTLALAALAFIVVNERFGKGVPETWLATQVILFFLGLYRVSVDAPALGGTLLGISVAAGLIGFADLYFHGTRRFTKPLLPGLKG